MKRKFNGKRLFSICLSLMMIFTFFTATSVNTVVTTASTVKSDALVKEVIRLCNAERAKNKLKPLAESAQLYKLALLKSQDMVNKNYFAHKSPTYGDSKSMMKMYKVKYSWLGENLGKANNVTAAQLVQSWMGSTTHRRNILNPNFTLIGVAYAKAKNGNLLWTQLFMKP